MARDEGEHQTGGAFAILLGVSGQCGTEGLVQCLLGNLVHFVQSLPDGLPVGKPRGDGGGHETVVTVQFRRGDTAGQLYQVVQLHHVPVVASDIDTFQVGGLVALLAVDFAQYLVLLSVHVEVAHTLSAQAVLQSLGNVLGAYAHDTRLVTVDVDARFRLAELQVYVCHLEYRIFVDLRHELGEHLLQFLDISCLQYILHGHTAAPSSE